MGKEDESADMSMDCFQKTPTQRSRHKYSLPLTPACNTEAAAGALPVGTPCFSLIIGIGCAPSFSKTPSSSDSPSPPPW